MLDVRRNFAIGLTLKVDDVGKGALKLIDQTGLHRRPSKYELSSLVTLDEFSACLLFVLREEGFEDVSQWLQSLIICLFIECLTFIENNDGWVDVEGGVLGAFRDRM